MCYNDCTTVAFIRAITADFEVLFGDEPTGNLDTFYASELMTVLKNNITKNNSSAIIVTHDIELAMSYADQVILISKPEPEKAGIIHRKDAFTREGEVWKDGDGAIVVNPEKLIRERLAEQNVTIKKKQNG
jgi:ABC-type cobalamin/Fe3+-siderophores transport system ATPase subunit